MASLSVLRPLPHPQTAVVQSTRQNTSNSQPSSTSAPRVSRLQTSQLNPPPPHPPFHRSLSSSPGLLRPSAYHGAAPRRRPPPLARPRLDRSVGARRRVRLRLRRGLQRREAGPARARAGGDEAVVPGGGVRGHAGGRRVPVLHALERGVPRAGHAVRRRGLPRHRAHALPQRRQRDVRGPDARQRVPLRVHARVRRVRRHRARRLRRRARRLPRARRSCRRWCRWAGGRQSEQHKWHNQLEAPTSCERVVVRPLRRVHATQREHPRRQHPAHRRALLPLRLRRHRHRSRRDQGRRMEGALDHQPAQDLRGDRHGHRAAPDAPEPPAALVLRLRLRLRHLQPHRRRHRHCHRRHHAGPGGRLDICRVHGPRHGNLHLRLHQPPPL